MHVAIDFNIVVEARLRDININIFSLGSELPTAKVMDHIPTYSNVSGQMDSHIRSACHVGLDCRVGLRRWCLTRTPIGGKIDALSAVLNEIQFMANCYRRTVLKCAPEVN